MLRLVLCVKIGVSCYDWCFVLRLVFKSDNVSGNLIDFKKSYCKNRDFLLEQGIVIVDIPLGYFQPHPTDMWRSGGHNISIIFNEFKNIKVVLF